MSNRALAELAAVFLLLTLGACGTVSGWLRDTRPSRTGIAPAAVYGLREQLSLAGLDAAYLRANAVDGDTVNLTLRLTQPDHSTAFQVEATMAYGWHVIHVERFG